MKAHVSDKKKKEVEVLKELMNKYKVVGIIDLTGMPSPQLQKMRKKLKDALIRVTKKRLIKIALENLKEKKKGIEQLENEMKENVMPCLILTNEDSFRLAKILRKSKSNVVAKAGQAAPNDIVIKAGPTSFAPGPIIGELGALGIKSAVEGGKITIKQDKILVKEGDEINSKVADMLAKMGIEPMQIGLNLIATYDNGVIFKKDVLDVDDKWYVDAIKSIASDGFKLAIQIGYVCKDSVEFLIKKAEMEAKALDSAKKKVKSTEKAKVEVKVEAEKEIKEEFEKKPAEERIEILKKKPFKKPSAQELINEVEKEVEKNKEDKVPTAAELAAKRAEEKKKEPKKIPTAAELAERKKEKKNGKI